MGTDLAAATGSNGTGDGLNRISASTPASINGAAASSPAGSGSLKPSRHRKHRPRR